MSFLDSLVDAVKAGSSAIKEVNAEVECIVHQIVGPRSKYYEPQILKLEPR